MGGKVIGSLNVYCSIEQRKRIRRLADHIGGSMAAAIHDAVAERLITIEGEDEYDD